jgi:hypothetical protein
MKEMHDRNPPSPYCYCRPTTARPAPITDKRLTWPPSPPCSYRVRPEPPDEPRLCTKVQTPVHAQLHTSCTSRPVPEVLQGGGEGVVHGLGQCRQHAQVHHDLRAHQHRGSRGVWVQPCSCEDSMDPAADQEQCFDCHVAGSARPTGHGTSRRMRCSSVGRCGELDAPCARSRCPTWRPR